MRPPSPPSGTRGEVVALVALPPTREAGQALGLGLAGRSVVHRTLAALDGVEGLTEIVLAGGPAPASVHHALEARGPRPPAWIATPAEHPWESLCRALQAAAPAPAVLLLDANRPLVSPTHLAALLAEVAASPAAVSAVPVRSTCKEVADGTITSTLRREDLLHTRRPAAFQRATLQRALARAAAEDRPPAGDAALCRWAGVPVRIVEDGPGNLPVETADDAELAELMLRPAPLAR